MSPSLASERATVQNPLIGYAVEIGWAYVGCDGEEVGASA